MTAIYRARRTARQVRSTEPPFSVLTRPCGIATITRLRHCVSGGRMRKRWEDDRQHFSHSFRNELLPGGPLLPYEVDSEEQLRLVDVVRATAELDVFFDGCTSDGVRLNVMELEKRGLATAPFCANERATSAVAPPHVSAHSGRDMARALGARSRCARSRSLGKAPALETFNQQRERAVEDLGGVSRRHSVPKQRLGAAELVVRFSRHRELNPVALGCERRDARS